MAEITDRIPFNLHPVCGWISMASDTNMPERTQKMFKDFLFGWAFSIDGETYGVTWKDIEYAIRSETQYWSEKNADSRCRNVDTCTSVL